ncbi:MAG: hypothetical protein AAGH65_12865, partial [Pseudomonadota bacterium]
PTGQWLLSGAHEDTGTELAISGVFKGEWVNAIVDRTFIDAGCRWIIDYKSGYHSGGNLDHFLNEEADRYRDQLARYAQLFSLTGESNIQAALYFPRHQALKIVELR